MDSTSSANQFRQLLDEFKRDPRSVQQRSAEELLDRLRPEVESIRQRQQFLGTQFRGHAQCAQPPDAVLKTFWDPELRLFRPRSTEQVRQLVAYARRHERRLRVLGSRHSVPSGIFGRPMLDFCLVLDGELRKIQPLASRTAEGFERVKVGGGCRLGPSPALPRQPEEDTLTRWLEARGLALPLTGGITHQTIAGFLQTGSEGGSLTHSFADAVEELELVDGTGQVRTLRRGSDAFAAAGVSMGLFGIITQVTLKVGASYQVEGDEGHQELADSLLAREAGGGSSLVEALHSSEYLRLNWFPQKHVQRVTQWRGRQVPRSLTPSRPYETALRDEFSNVMAALVLKIIDGSLGVDPNNALLHEFIGTLMKPFLPLGAPQKFRDAWHLTLPMDDAVRTDDVLKVLFTELWFPLERTDEVLGILHEVLADQRVAGNLAVELYAGKPSPFWLSPAHEGGSLRVNPYRWAYNAGSPRDLFEHYWRRLLDVEGVRLHWGKFLPEIDQLYGRTRFDLDYLRGVYPRMEDWLALRQEMDPEGLFLNDHWERLLLPLSGMGSEEPPPPAPKPPPPCPDLVSKGRRLLAQGGRAAALSCLTLLDKLYGLAVRE